MIPDGAIQTIGAKADTAVTDSTQSGTLMSFLKGLVKIFADVWDVASHALGVTLKTKIQAIVSGVENDNILSLPGRRSDAFQAIFSSADATAAAELQALSSGKSIYLTDIIISTDTAMNIKVQDSAGTPVVLIGPLYLPASGTFSKTFDTPLKTTISKALNVIASVSGNISVTASGYII